MSLTVSLLFLLFISAVVAQDGWAVYYRTKSICALKGSTVTMSCFSKYATLPSQYFTWSKNLYTDKGPLDLVGDPEYRGRVQYHGDQQQFTLRLKNVTEKDQSKYYCRCIKDGYRRRWQEAGGVDLSVTDLQVEVPERVIEGDNVTLTCKTTCSLTVRPTFTWYRNQHRLSSSTDQLHLQSVSREDTGRYRCVVLRQNSLEVTLNVRYGPKNISVSLSPSAEIVEGSSVNLTCISDANPPVQNYTWFKEGGSSPVGSGHSYSFNIDSKSSGWYYCSAQNEHGSIKSAAVPIISKAERSMTLGVVVGVGLCEVAVFIVVVFLMWNKIKKKRTMEEDDHQNVDPNAKDDTYTALDPVSRSSDDVYNTLTTVNNKR
ncbi:B-cell receptor CD22-like [Colossoma macropomum]|uniref:B-cell receptor CD22-like n=1 Tax=Colossoma macropomum TaxID=42526 RepID=UPI001864627D|nr:B-cell receptor CD22-like [Colossoma macropomum]